MKTYHNYDPINPFTVTGESHVIDSAGRVKLDYIPLKGSVSISGYTETTSQSPGLTEYYIDYQDSTAYRTAKGIVQFNVSAAAATVSMSYSGVSTLIWAEDMNEIKAHLDASAIDSKTLCIPGATDGASPAQYLPYSKKLKEVRLLFRDAKFASVTASASTTILVKKVVSGTTTTIATIAATVDTIYDVSPDTTVEAGAYVYACFSGANNGVAVANVVLVWGG